MSGIDNLVSHIEKNQSQKDGIISGAEWQLVAKVLWESSREEWETFSKQDIRKLDKEQQQQAKKDNAVEKNNKEYNNSLKKAFEPPKKWNYLFCKNHKTHIIKILKKTNNAVIFNDKQILIWNRVM